MALVLASALLHATWDVLLRSRADRLWSITVMVLVSCGIIGLSLGRERLNAHATVLALASGGFIAGYMVCDGMGVRLSGQPFGYFAWMSLAQAAPMPFAYFALRRRWPAVGLDRE